MNNPLIALIKSLELRVGGDDPTLDLHVRTYSQSEREFVIVYKHHNRPTRTALMHHLRQRFSTCGLRPTGGLWTSAWWATKQRLFFTKNSGYKHIKRPILAEFHFNLINLDLWRRRILEGNFDMFDQLYEFMRSKKILKSISQSWRI